MTGSKTCLVRIWLPDRPGALGAVALRLGSLRGDVVGLEIIERGGGRAIDEVVVVLPEDVPLELVAREIASEGDVEVEDIRLLEDTTYDPQLDAFEVASILLGSESAEDLAQALCDHVGRGVRSSWACVIEDQEDADSAVLALVGPVPSAAWITSFVAGSRAASSAPDEHGDPVAESSLAIDTPLLDTPLLDTLLLDTLWMPLPAAGALLVIGRDQVFRARERQRVAALARVADAWFRRLADRSFLEGMIAHPAAG